MYIYIFSVFNGLARPVNSPMPLFHRPVLYILQPHTLSRLRTLEESQTTTKNHNDCQHTHSPNPCRSRPPGPPLLCRASAVCCVVAGDYEADPGITPIKLTPMRVISASSFSCNEIAFIIMKMNDKLWKIWKMILGTVLYCFCTVHIDSLDGDWERKEDLRAGRGNSEVHRGERASNVVL